MTEVSAPTTAGERLVFQDTIFINPSVTRQWVDIKVFAFPAEMDDQTALGLLLAHVRYRDSYADAEGKDMGDIHGPYRLDAITPHSFTVVDPAEVQTLIATWAEFYGPWRQGDREAMDRDVYGRIAGAAVVYGLPDMRATAQHDWGWVVGGDGFHEFVTINRTTGELALIVASDD